jgi:hypothetical protein
MSARAGKARCAYPRLDSMRFSVALYASLVFAFLTVAIVVGLAHH